MPTCHTAAPCTALSQEIAPQWRHRNTPCSCGCDRSHIAPNHVARKVQPVPRTPLDPWRSCLCTGREWLTNTVPSSTAPKYSTAIAGATACRCNRLSMPPPATATDCHRHRLSPPPPATGPPRHATPRHATPRHTTPRHTTPRHATLCSDASCHATSRCATPRHATLRRASGRFGATGARPAFVARFPPLFIAVASMRWFVSSSWMPLGVVVRAWFAYRSLVSVSYVATLRSRVLHS